VTGKERREVGEGGPWHWGGGGREGLRRLPSPGCSVAGEEVEAPGSIETGKRRGGIGGRRRVRHAVVTGGDTRM
jgi:hypothetical protein